MNDRSEVRRIFGNLLAQPPVSRDTQLEVECKGDAALREEVKSLLVSHEKAGAFLEDPTVTAAEVPFGEPSVGGVGTWIGRYQLLERIGEGGCGVVYRAEQVTPLRRQVALKVIKPGMDTREVISRFQAERQALALMDHPNIARVLDAGESESGLPYFVMELVTGLKITDYCDEHRLTCRERLELFGEVCLAVQHAHQKGVIHRDIKPSNVLVVYDGKPAPKIIDFGIAKAIHRELAGRTMLVQEEQFVGTPQYMSPEQTEEGGPDVDTRADIYSLGVLLYELLAGTPPFERQALEGAGHVEMRRIIREVEPPAPSMRLSRWGLGEREGIAQRRRISARQLDLMLRGELDWIVMKCLEKDRQRRYETVQALAADLQRYLRDEVVLARASSAPYRMWKVVRRNKGVCAWVGAILMSLVAGTLVSAWEALRATNARAQAESALMESESARSQAQIVSKYLVDSFRGLDPNRNSHDTRMIDVLDRAAANLDTDFPTDTPAKADILVALGQTYTSLGEPEKSISLLEKAKSLRQTLLGADHVDTLSVNIEIARNYRAVWRLSQAIPLLEETLGISRAKLGPNAHLTLSTMTRLGDAYRYAGRAEQAIAMLEDARSRSQNVLGADDPLTLSAMNNLALAYEGAGRVPDAIALLEETRRRMTSRLGMVDADTLTTSNNLADAYRASGQAADGVAILQSTLAACLSQFGGDHPETLSTMNLLGDALRASGRSTEAVPLLEETLRRMRAKLGEQNSLTLAAMNNLGLAYEDAGRKAEAVELLQDTLERMTAVLGPDHPDTQNTSRNLAAALRSPNRPGGQP